MKPKSLEEINKEYANRPWYTKFYYFLYRRFWAVVGLPRATKMLFQRIIKGYDQDDIYNFHSFILRKLYKPLNAFVDYQAEHGMGTPMEFERDPAAWLNVLREIQDAFREVWSEEEMSDEFHNAFMKMTDEQRKARQEKIDRGMILFGKHWRSFWD